MYIEYIPQDSNEPPLLRYTLMWTTSRDLQGPHYMVEHFQARTSTEAYKTMKRLIQDLQPGVYWFTRSPEAEDIATVRAQ